MSSKENNSWVLVGKDGRTHDLSHGMIFIGREECDIVLQVICNYMNIYIYRYMFLLIKFYFIFIIIIIIFVNYALFKC